MSRYDVEHHEYDLPEALYQTTKQLRARCLRCGHDQTHGTPYRHRDDTIHLDEFRQTTYAKWEYLRRVDKTLRLFCADCEQTSWQAPRGSIEVDE